MENITVDVQEQPITPDPLESLPSQGDNIENLLSWMSGEFGGEKSSEEVIEKKAKVVDRKKGEKSVEAVKESTKEPEKDTKKIIEEKGLETPYSLIPDIAELDKPLEEVTPAKEDVVGSTEYNIKQLRTANQELLAKVKAYEEAGIPYDKLKDHIETVQKLSTYESLFGLTENPLFKQKFEVPAVAIIEELKTIAYDNAIEESIVHEALGISNRKQLNEYLRDSVDDDDARAEIKTKILDYQKLQLQKEEELKKPKQALESYRKIQEDNQRAFLLERDNRFQQIQQVAWETTLKNLTTGEDKIPEVSIYEGYPEHNEKVVEPIRRDSQALFSTILNYIKETGGGMGGDVATLLAKMCIETVSAKTLRTSLKAHVEALNKYKEKMEEMRKVSRPDLKSPINKDLNGADGKPLPLDARLDQVWEKIIKIS